MKIINIDFVIFLFLSLITTKIYSNEIKTLASVNDISITNYDVLIEVNTLEKIKKKKFSENEKRLILQELINEKIKELEINSQNIEVSNEIINNNLLSVVGNRTIPKNISDHLKKKLTINMKWNRLINLKFSGKLEVNVNEINESLKSNKNKITKDKALEINKNKKINLMSNNYFKEIKKKYLIKIYIWNPYAYF